MKETYRFLLTASILLATTFTLSCSSDDDESPDVSVINLSELQNMRVTPPIESGDLVLGGYITVGKITNGKLSFDSLPNIKSNYSEYLTTFSEANRDWETGFDYPSGLSLFYVPYSTIYISSGESCYIELYTVKPSGEKIETYFVYFSQPGSITGTVTHNTGDVWTETWDANFSEGWNFLYNVHGDNAVTHTSRHPGGDYEWQQYCN